LKFYKIFRSTLLPSDITLNPNGIGTILQKIKISIH
jgi:hypothetical protein